MSATGGAGKPPADKPSALKNITVMHPQKYVGFGSVAVRSIPGRGMIPEEPTAVTMRKTITAPLGIEGPILTPQQISSKYLQTIFDLGGKQKGVGGILRRSIKFKSPASMEKIEYNDPLYEEGLATYAQTMKTRRRGSFVGPETAAERGSILEKTGKLFVPAAMNRGRLYPAEIIENTDKNAEGRNLSYKQEYNNNPFKPSVGINNAYNALNEAAAGRPRAIAHNYNAEPLEGVYSGSVAEFSAGVPNKQNAAAREGVYTANLSNFIAGVSQQQNAAAREGVYTANLSNFMLRGPQQNASTYHPLTSAGGSRRTRRHKRKRAARQSKRRRQ